MMSHYGLPFEYDDHWICGALELSIETLAGTAFEIKVSPNDTIMAIKSKIQSVEGIPVSQQHLLYNLEELDNSASIRDYSIHNGATLKLVLSMRGGPISTKRLPPVDEMAWRELQELMTVTRKDDIFEKLPAGSRVTVLIFRDGDQVNLLRVVENEDGSFAPLSESWNGSAIRNLFTEEESDESAKRLQENSITMGKIQELKEKLENLSIQRREKKKNNSKGKLENGGESNNRPTYGNCSACEFPKRKNLVNFPSGDCSRPRCLKLVRKTEQGAQDSASFRPRSRLVPSNKASATSLAKVRKEAENIIRLQSNLSVSVDPEPNQGYRIRRTPLPDIHRSSRPDEDNEDGDDDKKSDDEGLGKNLRGKTARSFAIVEENDVAATTGLCSSRSSMVALPSSDEVAIACSQIPRETSTAITRSRFRVSRYVVDEDRPKTTPGKLDNRETSGLLRRQHCILAAEPECRKRLPATHNVLPGTSGECSRRRQADSNDGGDEEGKSSQTKKREAVLPRNPSGAEDQSSALFSPHPMPPLSSLPESLPPPVVKKRLRCSECKKKLNITNAYTCRCGGMFCAVHRYSEVHNCVFDYKEEGRKILQQANPLVAASKLPKL